MKLAGHFYITKKQCHAHILSQLVQYFWCSNTSNIKKHIIFRYHFFSVFWTYIYRIDIYRNNQITKQNNKIKDIYPYQALGRKKLYWRVFTQILYTLWGFLVNQNLVFLDRCLRIKIWTRHTFLCFHSKTYHCIFKNNSVACTQILVSSGLICFH